MFSKVTLLSQNVLLVLALKSRLFDSHHYLLSHTPYVLLKYINDSPKFYSSAAYSPVLIHNCNTNYYTNTEIWYLSRLTPIPLQERNVYI